MPVQAAEIALRRQLGLLDLVAVAVRNYRTEVDATIAEFSTVSGAYRVRVRTVVDPATSTRLTCNAAHDNPVPRHDVLSIESDF
jgi:hypothetical protein